MTMFPVIGIDVLLDLLWWNRGNCPLHARPWDIFGLFGNA
jgi:hypothetical protein